MLAHGVIARGARSLSTESIDAAGRVWEAIGRKADTQWVATSVGGALLASVGALGTGLYFATGQRFVKLESRIDAVESKLESRIDAVETKIDNLTQIVMQAKSSA